MTCRPTPAAETFDDLMAAKGWALFPGLLAAGQVSDLSADCDRVYDICRAVQQTNGVAANMEGTAHHVAGYGGPLDDFLHGFPLTDWVDRFFGASGSFSTTARRSIRRGSTPIPPGPTATCAPSPAAIACP